MAKLYFRYGCVGSAKTLNLLSVAHNYRQQGKNVLLLKPKIDTRSGPLVIGSRAGLEKDADFCLCDKSVLTFKGVRLDDGKNLYADEILSLDKFDRVDCVLVDEAQFLNTSLIEQLHMLSIKFDIPVICYGLKTDFLGFLFEGSKRLLELAESIEEVKTTCFRCNSKATQNLRIADGQPVFQGNQIEIGADELYQPVCKRCLYALKHP